MPVTLAKTMFSSRFLPLATKKHVFFLRFGRIFLICGINTKLTTMFLIWADMDPSFLREQHYVAINNVKNTSCGWLKQQQQCKSLFHQWLKRPCGNVHILMRPIRHFKLLDVLKFPCKWMILASVTKNPKGNMSSQRSWFALGYTQSNINIP